MKGVANRRRIWEACEVLGEVYAEAVVALPDLLNLEECENAERYCAHIQGGGLLLLFGCRGWGQP
jgi:hypothetical protein